MKEHWDKSGNLIWVAPSAVKFNREHIDFLLPILGKMIEGWYPAEPNQKNSPKSRRFTHAHFEIICEIAAEIETRLARTKQDRYLVEDKYLKGMSEEEIARKTSMDEIEVENHILSAVSYISSGHIPRWIETEYRKAISYSEWRNNRRRQWLR